MKNRRARLLLAGVSLAASLPAAAQFDQNIAVEGKYVPEVIRLDRINSFPRRERFALESEPLSFDGTGVPAAFEPRLIAMPATGWRSTRRLQRERGYMDLLMGSWLDTDLSAGYRAVDTENTVAGIRFQYNSTSLWKPELTARAQHGMRQGKSDTRQERYDGTIGLYAAHTFANGTRLDGSADYHLGYFNYYGWNPSEPTVSDGGTFVSMPCKAGAEKAPTQTLNDVSVRLSLQSPSRSDDFSWHAGAGARYFGYRACPMPGMDLRYSMTPVLSLEMPAGVSLRGSRETDININGGVMFPLSSSSAIGLDLDADILMYGGGLKDGALLPAASPLAMWNETDNYGLVTLTPYYRFRKNRMSIRLGLNADIASDAGPSENRFGRFHLSPDVAFDVNGGPVQFFVHLLGGTELHTLASGYELDYYQQPVLGSTMPSFTPFDGRIGISAGPFGGVSAGVDFGYKVSKNVALGGWYQTLLNYGTYAMDGLPAAGTSGPAGGYLYTGTGLIDMHGYSLGFNLKCDFGRAFSVEGRAEYQPQKGKTGYFNGYDRPRWTLLARAVSNPWHALRLELSYEYRGVRGIYVPYVSDSDANGFYETDAVAYRLPDICRLNFSAAYDFTERFSVRAQADNLLGSHAETLPGLPSQGVVIAAGVSYRF